MDAEHNTPTIISREDAKAQGLKRYFDGNPCKRGHVAERNVAGGHCIPCATMTAEAWYAANPERVSVLSKEWKRKNKEKVSAYNQKWNAENAELRSSLGREWREANKEKCRSDAAAWARANPEAKAALNRNRHARKRNAEGTHTEQDIKDLYAAQKGRCAYCKIKVGDTYHVDHIHPLIKGGRNDKQNLQICCPTCNVRKKDKDPIKFAQELGFLL